MKNKLLKILKITLGIVGVLTLFTKLYLIGILLILSSYLLHKYISKPRKTDWLDLYNSQNRAGKRKMKRDLQKQLSGKNKYN